MNYLGEFRLAGEAAVPKDFLLGNMPAVWTHR